MKKKTKNNNDIPDVVLNGFISILQGLIEIEKFCQARDNQREKDDNGIPSWLDNGMH